MKIRNNLQKVIYRAVNDADFQKKLNNGLPTLETIVATGFYSLAIWNNKDIEKDRKPALHYQNLICGASGILLSRKINKFISKYQEPLCIELEKRKNIPKLNNLITGIKVATPIFVFTFLLRYLLPTIATPVSTYIEKLRLNKKK